MTYYSLKSQPDISSIHLGTDGHRRAVQAIEYHFGNYSVRVHDRFSLTSYWMSIQEWNAVNPGSRIVEVVE